MTRQQKAVFAPPLPPWLASTTRAAEAFTNKAATVESGNFVVMPGTPELDLLDMEQARRNEFAGNFKAFIARVGEQFDVCVIDTAPTLDIRMKAAVISTDYLIAPIQLAQEAIDGLRSLLHTVSAAKDSLNPGFPDPVHPVVRRVVIVDDLRQSNEADA